MTKKSVTDYLARAIHRCGKSHKEIAADAGFESANMISMMKAGHTKVPLARVPQLASALEVEVTALLDICLKAYYPEIREVIRETRYVPGA